MVILADILEEMLSMPSIIFVVMGIIAVVSIVFSTISTAVTKISVARAREQSRREIAAYVAEGSIEADKAIEMLNAGRPGKKDGVNINVT